MVNSTTMQLNYVENTLTILHLFFFLCLAIVYSRAIIDG